MPKLIDRAGQRFGRLLVLEQAGRDRCKKVLWRCRCSCGEETIVTSGALVTGNTVSCGCYLQERITKHGGWKKSSYNTWRAMMRRCTVPTDKDYPRYGGVGVSVCPEWYDYLKFVADMGEPQGDETLDRIDTYGNYELSNCRWAGVKTQNRNVRVRKSNSLGVTGVRLRGSRYIASVTVKNKKYEKSCVTLDEAIVARKELEKIYWSA